jgi:hypothetical protein
MKRKSTPRTVAPEIKFPLVAIEWIDASRLSGGGWIDLKDVPNPYTLRCVSVGYLVADNEHGKTLVPTIGNIEDTYESHTFGGMMIPASAILAERRLKQV